MEFHGLKPIHIAVVCIIAVILVAAIWAGRAGFSNEPAAYVTFSTSPEVTFRCEVADTDAERADGLMHREILDNDSGMLFVFDVPQTLTFWMKNTLIPLDIIFIGEDGRVINIAEADPEPGVSDSDLTRYSSLGPAKWVLEINQGLSAQYGIVPDTFVIIEINS